MLFCAKKHFSLFCKKILLVLCSSDRSIAFCFNSEEHYFSEIWYDVQTFFTSIKETENILNKTFVSCCLKHFRSLVQTSSTSFAWHNVQLLKRDWHLVPTLICWCSTGQVWTFMLLDYKEINKIGTINKWTYCAFKVKTQEEAVILEKLIWAHNVFILISNWILQRLKVRSDKSYFWMLLTKVAKIFGLFLGYFEKHYLFCKNQCDYVLLEKNWPTFYYKFIKLRTAFWGPLLLPITQQY